MMIGKTTAYLTSALYSTALTGGTRQCGSEETCVFFRGGGNQATKREPKDEKYYIALVPAVFHFPLWLLEP